MEDNRPQYPTMFDLIFEAAHITLIAAGCYVGWRLGGHFPAMVVGGAVARIAWMIGWSLLFSRFHDE